MARTPVANSDVNAGCEPESNSAGHPICSSKGASELYRQMDLFTLTSMNHTRRVTANDLSHLRLDS